MTYTRHPVVSCSFIDVSHRCLVELPRVSTKSWRKVRVLADANSGKVTVMSGATHGCRLAASLRPLPSGAFVAKTISREKVASALAAGRRAPANELAAALLVGSLHAPNVVEVYGVAQDEERFYLAMEHCAHGELLGHARRTGACEDEGALREIAIQILTAVRALHDAGVAHRDICLENILVHEDEGIRLIDFAEAILVGGGASGCGGEALVDPVRHGHAGKRFYRPPEVWRGGPYAATKQDIFAIGVVLCILVAGEYPFASALDFATLFPAAEADADLCRPLAARLDTLLGHARRKSVSPAFVDFLQQLLAPNPEKRPSAEEALRHPWIRSSLGGAPWQVSAASTVVGSGSELEDLEATQ
eukprot:TRINITY_DN3311_c0_g4_i1.p1 TRINITY_DN3311_c0_g4~~TRINITY_DN3311_c0_g4_i1.p1  ORF type:complete len:397 (-),score=71.34 TRINITY_DN3311_c0_g4_i1:101-1183(-)